MKALLRERADLLKHWLSPASEADILKAVAALSPVMKRRTYDDNTSEAVLETYALDLADQPLFAIQDACTAYRRMLVGNGFMPMPGELLTETKKKAEWVRKEAFEIERILVAEVEDEGAPVARANMRDRVDALKATLRAARPKNEMARGYEQPVDPDEGLPPMEALERRVEAYRKNPVGLSFAVERRQAA